MIPEGLLEEFKRTVTTGGYNLLFGAGISLGSKNANGKNLPSTRELTDFLCDLKKTRKDIQLHRVASLLSANEKLEHLVPLFSGCTADSSLAPLPEYIWRRSFTFNIDDVLESLYASSSSKQQRLVSINYSTIFQPTPLREELQLVHLHGSVRQPSDGFVFSYPEYARIMKGQNPWMHLLAQILATEPFIISGTSLNEIDLEYYLSFRNSTTPRKGRGPSLYIEPYPDSLTQAECDKYGLVLVPCELGVFLKWLRSVIPTPPSLANLIIPRTDQLFQDVAPKTLLRFFSDFRPVVGGERARSQTPSQFLYGGEPELADLQQHLDIPRSDNSEIITKVETMRQEPSDRMRLLLLLDDPGTGKTTCIRRVAHNLASAGQTVVALKSVAKIDTTSAIECLRRATSSIVVVVDGFADHVEQIMEIVSDISVRRTTVFILADRKYREHLIFSQIAPSEVQIHTLNPMTDNERMQLIEQFRQFGLIGVQSALTKPVEYARRLRGDPVAVAVCRILNDFRPLDVICNSMWEASTIEQRQAFVCSALTEFCHPPGLLYSALRHIVGQHTDLDAMFTSSVPLGLAENKDDPDYVLPLNATVGVQILKRTSASDGSFLLECFLSVADAIASRVNRHAIMARTPEARLAGRLFDSDKVVRPLLKQRSNQFYKSAQNSWEWNSRYWEQRALMMAETDLTVAVQHAKHAVAIEWGPYALTTLGKLLMMQSQRDSTNRKALFAEAFKCLQDAIEAAHSRSRLSIHPFHAMLVGVCTHISSGDKLTAKQHSEVQRYIGEAEYYFAQSPMVISAISRVQSVLKS